MANLLCSAHDTVLPSPLYQAPREKTIILEGWVTMEADVEAERMHAERKEERKVRKKRIAAEAKRARHEVLERAERIGSTRDDTYAKLSQTLWLPQAYRDVGRWVTTRARRTARCGMVPSSSGAGVAWAAKRGRGVALELSADPRPLAAAAAAPSESNPLRWGPPPLEPIPDMGPRDSVFAAAASEDEPTVEADAPARSTISLMPRCLAVARPKP